MESAQKRPDEIGLDEFAQALLPPLEQMQKLVRLYGCTRQHDHDGWNGRVLRVAIRAAGEVAARHGGDWLNYPLPGVQALNDHKGTLQVTVDDSVSVTTLSALALAWESEFECIIELIYSQGGKVFSVDAGTEDVMKGLGDLLLTVSTYDRSKASA